MPVDGNSPLIKTVQNLIKYWLKKYCDEKINFLQKQNCLLQTIGILMTFSMFLLEIV